MLFGYIRDSRDWVPIIFLIVAIISGIMGTIVLLPPKQDDKMIKRHRLNQAKARLAVAGCLFFLFFLFLLANEVRHDYLDIYNAGCAYEERGDYEEAYETFLGFGSRAGDYKDVKQHLERLYPIVQYDRGVRAMSVCDFYQAYESFNNAGDYLDAKEMADYCLFEYLKSSHPEWWNE